MERVTGLEPVQPAWKAGALPTELYPQNSISLPDDRKKNALKQVFSF